MNKEEARKLFFKAPELWTEEEKFQFAEYNALKKKEAEKFPYHCPDCGRLYASELETRLCEFLCHMEKLNRNPRT
jgi:hypothetical protein